MKSCPKCNRTFPDEGQKFCTFDGGLLIAPQTYDPNVTIRGNTAEVFPPPSEKPTSRDLPDPNATIADSSFASTVALHGIPLRLDPILRTILVRPKVMHRQLNQLHS
jgi:hypothetical protein